MVSIPHLYAAQVGAVAQHARRLGDHRRDADRCRRADQSERLERDRLGFRCDVRPPAGAAVTHGPGRSCPVQDRSDRAVIEILTSNAFNTIQDLGRRGKRRFGVSPSGAMDPVALEAGNALLGNDGDAAGIEVQTFPFRLRFRADMAFALTGADHDAALAGRTVPPWWCMRASAGDILTIDLPRRGARVYVAFEGGIDVPRVLGSRSTHLR